MTQSNDCRDGEREGRKEVVVNLSLSLSFSLFLSLSLFIHWPPLIWRPGVSSMTLAFRYAFSFLKRLQEERERERIREGGR